MNGRVQDAITGRFLSADPVIPDLLDTQSYNRYSYVNNRPLSYVDPSGFDDCSDTGDNGDTGDDGDQDTGGGSPDPTPPQQPDSIRTHAKDQNSCQAPPQPQPTFTGSRIPGGLPPLGYSCTGNCWTYNSSEVVTYTDENGQTKVWTGNGTWTLQSNFGQIPSLTPQGGNAPQGSPPPSSCSTPGVSVCQKPNNPPLTTPFFQALPCESWGAFFADNNAALGYPTSVFGVVNGSLSAGATVVTVGKTIGSLPIQGLFTAPTVGAAIIDASTVTGALAAAFFLGSQGGSIISATVNRVTCH